jgi:hypothetical protein
MCRKDQMVEEKHTATFHICIRYCVKGYSSPWYHVKRETLRNMQAVF